MKLCTGAEYTASRVRKGSGTKGDWELIVVKAEKGWNEITIFPVNIPSRVIEGNRFRIDGISSVEVKNIRNKQTGEFEKAPRTYIEAIATPIIEEEISLDDSFGDLDGDIDI